MISEHVRDIKADCMKAKGEMAADTEHSGAWVMTALAAGLARLEKCVAITSKKPGCAVGASSHPNVSLADLEIWSLIHDCQWAGTGGVTREVVSTATVLCPNLIAIAAKVQASPVLQAYVGTRTVAMA